MLRYGISWNHITRLENRVSELEGALGVAVADVGRLKQENHYLKTVISGLKTRHWLNSTYSVRSFSPIDVRVFPTVYEAW